MPLYYRSKRWKLDAQHTGTFWLSETPDKYGSKSWGSCCPRVVTWGRFIEQRSGRTIYVFNTHFDHISEAARQKAAMMLADRIVRQAASEPVIVTGDLNSGENAVAVNILTGNAQQSPIRLLDTFRAVRPDAKDVGTFHGFTGVPTNGAKIDYILVNPGAKVLSAEILREHYLSAKSRERRSETIRVNHGERYPSDHFPVTAEVVWP